MILVVIVVLCVALFFLLRLWHSHKTPKVGSLALVTGGVKTGKTTFAVHLALKNYKRALLRWRILSFLSFINKKWKNMEKPLLYSNIPLTCDYVPVTRDMLLRKVRFNYKSVILLSEASLVADSQLIKLPEVNSNLLLFCKLIAHETKGGMLVLDTQSISDLHYGFKRCLSEYFYIHHIFKFLPGYIVAWICEQRYSDDGSVISSQEGDVEETLNWFLIPKRVWKVFDCYTYSALTDKLLPVTNVMRNKRDDLKSKRIVSFRDEFCKVGYGEPKKLFKPVILPIKEVPNNEKKDN